MILVSTISFCFAALIWIECVVRKSDPFSPERFYLFFHAIGLGVAFLGLHEAMTPFRPLTSLVYFGSAATFVLGVWTVKLLMGAGGPRVYPDLNRYNWKLHLWLAFALFVFFLGGLIVAYSGAGEFPLLAKRKGDAIGRFFEVSLWASIGFSYGGVVAYLFFIAVFKRPKQRSFVIASLMMIVATIGFFSLALSRSGQVFFGLSALLFYHYAIRRLSLWKLSFAFSAFALLVLVTGYQKAYSLAERYDLEPGRVFQMALTIPYMYFANNYWNLDYALNRENHVPEHPQTFGYATASGVINFMPMGLGVGIRDMGGFDDQFNKSSVKVRGWNTFPYQWALYKEFRVPGVLAGAFALGLLLGWMYCRVLAQPTVLNVAAYAFSGYFIAMSMFGYFPEASIYVYGLIYVVATCYFCQKLVARSETPGPNDEPASPS